MLYFEKYKERRSNVLDPHADTFLWIWDHPKYQTWEKGRASSLLWVQGKPGSGKSTLANFVRARVADRVDHRVNHSSIAVDFFYSARGGSLQNGHYWMLRSILYQFLLKAPGLWGSFLNDFMECRQIEQSDEWQGRSKASATGGLLEQLWSFNRMKALFGQLGSIHAPALELTAYVIIDALDESEELDRQEVIQMFRKVSMCHPSWPIAFKIFLTSRPSPRIEQVLRRCPTIVLENETQKDIVNYVNSETARIATNVLDCKHEELAFVSSYLIQWAQGVFLWVRLVLIELDERATEGFCSVVELEELLLSIPKDLRQLYERILTKIKKGLIRTTQECQTVLRWVAYSPRPLLIEEMVEVIATSACAGLRISAIELKRRRVGNAEDLRRRLISLCGNLVEVKGGIVQFIHTSVREFLLESVCDKGMSLVRADSLFEIASSCADYVDGFHDLLQYKAPLYASEERSIGENESYHDFSTYVQFIDELRLLRYIFGCGEAYLTSLDRELAKGSVNRSLRGTMSSACTTMQPAVIEAILAGEVRILDRLILYPDQINAIYSVPLEDPRLNNLFVKSIATNTDAYHITIMQMLSFLHTPGMLDILDLLHKRGADPNTQDELGRTSLHAAVQVGARAYRFLSQILNERSMPTIKDGFIDPHTRFLKACLHSGDSLLKAMINAMSLPCILLSSVLKYSAGVQLKDSDGENITLCTLMQYITQLGDKSAWAIAWTLKSAHAKLSRLLINNVTLITKVIREPLERFSHIFWRIANESGDEELKAASYALNHIRSFISRLLDHGADPTIRETASQNSPLDLALQSGDREIIFMLLNSFKERTEFKISIAKTKSEKSEILRGAGDLLARLVYHECSELSSDNIVNWIFDEFYNDRNFIFGNRSIKLWEMYVDQEGCTAMHIAAKKGQSRALTKMVNIGFPKDGLDGLGRTPMDIAKLNHRLTAVSSLMDNKKRQEHRVIWSWDDVGWRLIKKGDTV